MDGLPAVPLLRAVTVLDGVTIRTGWFRREQLALYEYEDGTRLIGYSVHVSADSFVVVSVLDLTHD